jgi:hypothetical protein
VKHPLWSYAGPVCGLLYVVLSVGGLVIHGYPSGSGAQIKHWIATANGTRFGVGIWIEALGYLLFVPFAAWLARELRRPGHVEWPADVAFGAAILTTGSALVINGLWTGVFDAGRNGADQTVLAAAYYLTSDAYAASVPFSGLFLVAAGAAAVIARSLPPWLAWAGVAIGVLAIIPPTAMPASAALWLWVLAVSGRAGMVLRTRQT